MNAFSATLAAPTQAEVFKSISSSMDSSGDIGPLLTVLGVAAVVGVVLVAYFQWRNSARRRKLLADGPSRQASSDGEIDPLLNRQTPVPLVLLPALPKNPKKLMRDVAADMGLTRQQLAKLKQEAKKRGLQHPLTLLLCPSLIGGQRDEPSGQG